MINMIKGILKKAWQIWRFAYMFPKAPLCHFIKKEDVTVIVPIRNIEDRYLVNCLKSIRGQTYDQSLIEIILVDYDSAMKFSALYEKACGQYSARYIKVCDRPVWNKSNALNIGIKEAKSKYILIADVDIIFEENYIEEGIKELEGGLYRAIVNQMLDLPDTDLDGKSYGQLKLLAKPRYNMRYHNAIVLTYAYFYHRIRGYDENYKLWAAEDDDLEKRFRLSGLEFKSTNGRTSYLHQYHEKYRLLKYVDGFQEQLEANKRYCRATNSIIRNRTHWGE